MQRQTKVRPGTGSVATGMPGALVMAPLVVGVAAVMALATASGAGSALVRSLRSRRSRGDEPDPGEMRRALLGQEQSHIAGLLGPPPTAAGDRSAEASTWYYPVGNRRRYAMAIRFDHGRAQAVDFVPA